MEHIYRLVKLGFSGIWFELWTIRHLPSVLMEHVDLDDNEILFNIFTANGIEIGQIMTSIDPSASEILLRNIQIKKAWRRQGFGSASIAYLNKRFRRPIAPVRVVDDGEYFWPRMKEVSGRSILVKEEVFLIR